MKSKAAEGNVEEGEGVAVINRCLCKTYTPTQTTPSTIIIRNRQEEQEEQEEQKEQENKKNRRKKEEEEEQKEQGETNKEQ